MADSRLMIRVVGSPERGELAIQVSRFIGELGGAQPVDGFRPRLLPDVQQLVADLIDGLIPGDPCPLPVNELHRVAQPPIAGHVIPNRGAFAAMRTSIDGTVIVRLLSGPHPIGDFTNDGTTDGAMCADILAARDLCAFGWRFARGGSSNTAELQGTQAGQGTCDQSGFAKKGTPIHSGALRRLA